MEKPFANTKKGRRAGSPCETYERALVLIVPALYERPMKPLKDLTLDWGWVVKPLML